MKKQKLLEVALEEIRNYGVQFRTERTRDNHIKIFIAGSPMIVVVGNGAHKSYDNILFKKIKADVRRSIGMIK